MPASAPISAGPRPPDSTVRAGGTASGTASSPSSAHGRADAHGGDDGERDDEQAGEQQPGPPVAEQDREGPLADERVAVDVAQVVDHQDRAR